ncbi:auxin-responsive protein SAUR71-like [Lotus japonicus]|uniref:Uncharacterized protein n=1 Tax=Lotus japonicus TaxID=34305 RepID=I3T0E7_LOTJA|nr:auxin-responsive protein SAUR71-like [Lotus japonicus]AFK45989.1 unknown [Lotus japonicus]
MEKIVGGISKFKIVFKKLQKIFLLRGRTNKEGHFAVIADDGEEQKRFVVPLSCLRNSTFVRLLEQAAEDYGFDQGGVLTIPCRPNELEMLLAQQWQQLDGRGRNSVTTFESQLNF